MSTTHQINERQKAELEVLSQDRGIPVERLMKQAVDRFIETERPERSDPSVIIRVTE